ncbi:MAG: MarR family winged helix-turn-helix transcriptional regulator [Planctomycetota bacterium]
MLDAVLAIQQAFPQVFHACHVRHRRARTDARRLSDRDSSVLAHIGSDAMGAARDLAKHFGVGAPAMSATLERLERLGYIERQQRSRTRPTRALALTAKGWQAMQATSVLDSERLTLLLGELNARDRKRAVDGLRLLARAASTMPRKERDA